MIIIASIIIALGLFGVAGAIQAHTKSVAQFSQKSGRLH